SPSLSLTTSQDGSTALNLVTGSPIAKPAWFSPSTLPRPETRLSRRSRSSLLLSLFPALHPLQLVELLAQLVVLLQPTLSRLAVLTELPQFSSMTLSTLPMSRLAMLSCSTFLP